jgi:sugar lactone lactonase YvrE
MAFIPPIRQHGSDKISLMLFVVAACTLIYLSALAASNGPVADFPSFTPIATDKTEGVAIDKAGNVYVSIMEGDSVVVLKYSPDGEESFFAEIGVGNANGLAIDAKGDVYVALAEGIDRGVYRVDQNGNTVMLPGTEQIAFANSLAFDKQGNLYVTETYSIDSMSAYGQGGIWRIPKGGEAELWLRDNLLTGTGAVLGFPIGANGIACYHGDLLL